MPFWRRKLAVLTWRIARVKTFALVETIGIDGSIVVRFPGCRVAYTPAKSEGAQPLALDGADLFYVAHSARDAANREQHPYWVYLVPGAPRPLWWTSDPRGIPKDATHVWEIAHNFIPDLPGVVHVGDEGEGA